MPGKGKDEIGGKDKQTKNHTHQNTHKPQNKIKPSAKLTQFPKSFSFFCFIHLLKLVWQRGDVADDFIHLIILRRPVNYFESI